MTHPRNTSASNREDHEFQQNTPGIIGSDRAETVSGPVEAGMRAIEGYPIGCCYIGSEDALEIAERIPNAASNRDHRKEVSENVQHLSGETRTSGHTEGQWPDNITSGAIRYGEANNYDGFYLADASHGIPTFGSVTETAKPTIRGQHVRVFNYPAQTEAIAAELVHRWNCHDDMLAALTELTHAIEDGLCNSGTPGFDSSRLERARLSARAALKASGGAS